MIDPRLAADMLRKTEAAIRADDLDKAVALARNALGSGLVHSLYFNLRAYWLEQQGRIKEALADLGNAVALDPTDSLVHNAFGLCLTRAERWKEAVAEFTEATRLDPKFVQAHFNLGWSYERIGELEPARQSFARAHELDSRNAEPLARLAALAARRADWDEADKLAKQALELAPNHATAKSALANVLLARRAYDQAERIIETVLSDPATPPFEHSFALSQKADLRHAQHRYGEAFEAYGRSNRERRGIFAGNFERDENVSAHAYVEWLCDVFKNADAGKWRIVQGSGTGTGGNVKAHAFLIGFPRSGTTLLENVLAANPAVVSLEEKEVLVDSVRAFLTNDDGVKRLEILSDEGRELYRRAYWKRVGEHVAVAGKAFIDKEPLATIKLPVIAKLFPGVKILFAIRDPRDVVLSCFRRQFAMNQSMFEFLTLEGAARYYDAVMKLGERYRNMFGLKWHIVRHEAVVDDFEGETRRACDFLGIEWTAEMVNFAERARSRPIATPSATQVLRGLNRDGMAQWRNYAAQLEPAMPYLRPWIEAFGYPED
jgi:Flp pilus assembly protein TadD